MVTKEDNEAIQLYANLMTEFKLRAYAINSITSNANGSIPAIVRESSFLQLRLMCELVALGCLVAHGDIPATKSLANNSYKPGEILKQLEKLHPSFFPVPVAPVFSPGHVHLDYYQGDYLTKEELIALWNKCGDVLHKGSLRKLLAARQPTQTNFPDIQVWGQKFMNLMSNHRLIRLDGLTTFVCLLEDKHGQVNVAFAQAPA